MAGTHGRPRGRRPRPPRSAPPHVDRARIRRLTADTRTMALLYSSPTIPAFEYVVIEQSGRILDGPYECVSRAAERWDPPHTFLRRRAHGGELVLLSERELAEAQRLRFAA